MILWRAGLCKISGGLPLVIGSNKGRRVMVEVGDLIVNPYNIIIM
jgi:hypothetical protein